MIRLFVEALVVEFVTMHMGYPVSMIALKLLPVKDDDHRPVMYLSLFLTSLLSHLLFEVVNRKSLVVLYERIFLRKVTLLLSIQLSRNTSAIPSFRRSRAVKPRVNPLYN